MAAPAVTLVFLALALAWSVFFKAGVWPADWDVTVTAVGLISTTYWALTHRLNRSPALPAWLKWPILLLPCYVAFQLIPLPLSVLAILSPARAQLTKSLAPIIPGIHSAPLSVDPPAAVPQLFTILCCIATFLLVRELSWRFSSRPWAPVIPLLVIAGFEASLGMSQVFAAWPGGEATGTFPNRDHFSGMLEMVLPLAILYGLAVLRRDRSRHASPALPALGACALWALAALILLAIIYSLSRMGFLDALCVLFFIAALSIGPRLPSRTWRWSSFGIIALLVLLMFVFLPPGQLIERFASISSSNQAMSDDRLFTWKDTLPLIREFRWFGAGLGSFVSVFLKHQTTGMNMIAEFAHNDYLNYMSELGFVGFAIVAAIFVGIAVQMIRGILRLEEEQTRLVVIACAASFVAIGLHSLVDFNLYIPANEMTLAWIAGIGSLNGLD